MPQRKPTDTEKETEMAEQSTERVLRARMSLDTDEHSHGYGYDEWIDVPEMDDPYAFIEECVADYIHYHSGIIEEMAGKPFHQIEDTRAFVDVTYDYAERS